MRKGKIASLAMAAVTLGGLGTVGLTGVASATTTGCTGGTYAGYCGTQTNAQNTPLSFDVYQQKAANFQPIIGYENSSGDPATDFFTFAYAGGTSKIFEYAPDGVASNYCITVDTGGKLGLRPCGGYTWQRFTATATGGANGQSTWTNVQDGLLITSHGNVSQLTVHKSNSKVNQEWTFETP